MTDLESPKKNNDCYFYYYSKCAKGDNCTFRHEPSALGCETMCSFWKEGKCLNVHCNFRHMELRKNRKVIPCYWESQPLGCLKAHCPFMHQNPRPTDEVSSEKSSLSPEKSNADAMLKEQLNQPSERKVTAVDSLVVNFEEESDSESAPTFSPIKGGNRIVKVKTLEEIKLEKIQAESAAYYSYYGQDMDFQVPVTNGDDLRQRIVRRVISKNVPLERTVTFKTHPHQRIRINKRLSNDDLANILGDESLRKKQKTVHHKDDGNFQVTLNKNLVNIDSSGSFDPRKSKNKSSIIRSKNNEPIVKNIKIKTLAEIRAEKNVKREDLDVNENSRARIVALQEREEAVVSSTSVDENINENIYNDQMKSTEPPRKIKLRRMLPHSEENVVTSFDKDENTVSSYEENILINEETPFSQQEQHRKEEKKLDKTVGSSDFKHNLATTSHSSRNDDEVLLLEEDDDEYDNVTLKAEDELLNEIDYLLSD